MHLLYYYYYYYYYFFCVCCSIYVFKVMCTPKKLFSLILKIGPTLMKICLYMYFCVLIPVMLLIFVYHNYLQSYRCFFWPLVIPWEKAHSYFIINDEHWDFSVI